MERDVIHPSDEVDIMRKFLVQGQTIRHSGDMRLASRPRRGAKDVAKVVHGPGLLLGAASLGSSAAESPNSPGFPSFEEYGELPNQPDRSWVGPQATAIKKVASAKQRARTPSVDLIGWNWFGESKTDPTCRREEGTDWHARIFFTSPADALEPFVYIGPFTVRTVAFDSVPVEAEALIAQARDAHNLPIDLSIVGLNADGIDLNVGAGCHPAEGSSLKLGSEPCYSLAPDVTDQGRAEDSDPLKTRFFGMANGGPLNGSVGIGDSTGCRTTAGEDVSQLLTTTVSGANNKVQMRSEGRMVETLRCVPDRSKCPEALPGLSYPERDAG